MVTCLKTPRLSTQFPTLSDSRGSEEDHRFRELKVIETPETLETPETPETPDAQH